MRHNSAAARSDQMRRIPGIMSHYANGFAVATPDGSDTIPPLAMRHNPPEMGLNFAKVTAESRLELVISLAHGPAGEAP